VPFGGRDAELARLDRWLEDPAAPRNLLITAPAGRGKTALLVRWLDRLRQTDWPIAFSPISIRYDTNRAAVFYQALASELAAVLEQSLPPAPADTAAFYKEKLIEYFEIFEQSDEHRALIVIDGLDEATGWQVDTTVLPPEPPPGLKIVVSARQVAGDRGSEDWLRRLGWTGTRSSAACFEVPPLQREGIRSALASLGVKLAASPEDDELIEELYRLTEQGDPLLVELYARDLTGADGAAPRFTVSDLRRLEPGYTGFFRDWFDSQETAWREAQLPVDRNEVNAILAVLSCALGPIKRAVLEPLVKALVPDFRLTWDALTPLRRFVLGDGSDIGFSLAHPKLAEFLRDDYFGRLEIIKKARASFVDWGRGLVRSVEAGTMKPSDVPEYCLLYHVQHLVFAEPQTPVEAYRELLDEAWQLAWRSHPDGLRGFARDAEVVMERLERAFDEPDLLKRPGVGLGGLFRCALCLSSMRSFGGVVPPNFLAELVRIGQVGPRQALTLCGHKADRYERAAALQAVAAYAVDDESAEEIVSQARGLADPRLTALTLATVALHAADPTRMELLRSALRALASGFEGPEELQSAIVEIVRLLSTYADRSPEPQRSELLACLPRLADELSDPSQRALLEQRPADSPIGARKPPTASVVADPLRPRVAPDDGHERVRSALTTGDPSGVLATLRPHLPGLPDESLAELLEHVAHWDSLVRRAALRDLLPYLSRDLLARAVDLVLDGGPRQYWEILDDLEPLAPRVAHDSELVARVVVRLGGASSSDLVSAIQFFAGHAPVDGEDVLFPILDQVEKYPGSLERAWVVGALAEQLPGRALSTVLRRVLGWSDRHQALAELAPRLPPELAQEAVAAVADTLTDLDVLLPSLSAEVRASTVSGMYKAGLHIHDDVPFVSAFASCTTLLAQADAEEAGRLAFEIAFEVREPIQRAQALVVVRWVPGISDAEREAIAAAIAQARAHVVDPTERLALDIQLMLFEKDERRAREALEALLVVVEQQPPTFRVACYAQIFISTRASDEEALMILGWYEQVPSDVTTRAAYWLPMLSAAAPTYGREVQTKLAEVSARLSPVADSPSDEDKLLRLTAEGISMAHPEESLDRILEIRGVAPGLRAASIAPFLGWSTGERLVRGARELIHLTLGMTRDQMLGQIASAAGGTSSPYRDTIRSVRFLMNRRFAESWVSRLGGPSVGLEIFQAIRDVRRWWP
jgi:hypothetical protein